jgi:hypothetical protein
MSYIQVEIGGKLRGLKFNQGAIMWMQDKIDPTNYEATTLYAIVWGGLKANCYVKGEEPDFNFEQVCDWVDSIPLEVNKQITECFMESQSYKKTVEVPDKKKESPEMSTEQIVLELQEG